VNEKLDHILQSLQEVTEKLTEQELILHYLENRLKNDEINSTSQESYLSQAQQKFFTSQETMSPVLKQESGPLIKPSKTVSQAEKMTPKIIYKEFPINWRAVEMYAGKYGLQVVGIIIFLVGMLFLIKYSIDQNWITPAVRVGIGFVVATALLIAAEYASRSIRAWALGCTAGSIVLYYISFYAAHIFYNLISADIAFIGLVGTTFLGGLLALRHNAFFIAIFSLCGGYLTPALLLQTTQLDYVFLSWYIVSLAAGFMALSYQKEWFKLVAMTAFGSFFWFIFISFDRASKPISLSLLIGLFAVYNVIPWLYTCLARYKKRAFEAVSIGMSGIVAINLFIGIFFFIPLRYENLWHPLKTLFEGASEQETVKYSCFIFGVLFLIQLVAVLWRNLQNIYVIGTLFSLAVYAFAGTMVTQWQGYSLSSGLHIYACALLFLGMWSGQYLARIFSYFFFIYSAINFMKSFWRYQPDAVVSVIWNHINLSCAIIFVMFAVAAYAIKCYASSLALQESKAAGIFFELGAILTIFYWLHTVVWSFPYNFIALVIYSGTVAVAGFVWQHSAWRSCAYLCMGLVGLEFLFTTSINSLLQENLIAYNIIMGLFVTLFLGLDWLYQSYKDQLSVKNQYYGQESAIVLTAATLCVWGKNLLVLYLDPTLRGLKAVFYYGNNSLVNTVLTVYFGLFAMIILFIGLIKQRNLLRYFGLSLIILTLSKLWFIIIELPNQLHRIVAFIAIGVLLTLISFIYQKISRD